MNFPLKKKKELKKKNDNEGRYILQGIKNILQGNNI